MHGLPFVSNNFILVVYVITSWLFCVGNRKPEQIGQTSSRRPQHGGGSSEPSSGGGGETKDSTEQDETDK